ncbi:helix-turn-helix transcriptional regulator [Candidatus Poribacteria bacterium]|nr:helix-turn-helix transcriptional regulator [Candidatus Poribacteria bacterium]
MNSDLANIAERIQECRKQKGLSQRELADAIGVSAQSISDFERRKSLPSLATLMKLTEFFEVDDLSYWLRATPPQIDLSEADSISQAEIPFDTDPDFPSDHLAYPFGLCYRSHFLGQLMRMVAEKQGCVLRQLYNDPIFYLAPSKKASRLKEKERLFFPVPNHFLLDENTLLVIGSPYHQQKHRSIWTLFQYLSLNERFHVSDKQDMYFGYPCRRSYIDFDSQKFFPKFSTTGRKSKFLDYAIYLSVRVPEGYIQVKDQTEIKRMTVVAGCHRVGSGAAFFVMINQKLRNQYLNEASVGENFEILIKVKAETGCFPSADNLSLEAYRTIDTASLFKEEKNGTETSVYRL